MLKKKNLYMTVGIMLSGTVLFSQNFALDNQSIFPANFLHEYSDEQFDLYEGCMIKQRVNKFGNKFIRAMAFKDKPNLRGFEVRNADYNDLDQKFSIVIDKLESNQVSILSEGSEGSCVGGATPGDSIAIEDCGRESRRTKWDLVDAGQVLNEHRSYIIKERKSGYEMRPDNILQVGSFIKIINSSKEIAFQSSPYWYLTCGESMHNNDMTSFFYEDGTQ